MKYKQIRFSPAHYVPRIHGYCRVSHKGQFDKGNSVPDQESRIKQYIELRRLDSNDPDFARAEFYRFWKEPRAQSAYLHELRQRPAGAKMLDDVKPGDYIIVDKLDRMFRNTLDFLQCRRFFAERGISLHFVSFLGMSVDTGSIGGGMMINMLAMMAEMESERIGERIGLARKQRMLEGKHSGGKVPFFCSLEGARGGKKAGAGGKLVFKPWALDAMAKIVQLRDETGKTFEMIGKDGIYAYLLSQGANVPMDDRRHGEFFLYRLYWFYKAWVAADKPDINTIRITELVDQYKATLGKASHEEPDTGGETADED